MSDFRVTEAAMRPASARRQCFYCHSPVGGVHGAECVLVHRRVVVRLEAKRLGVSHEYEIDVPAHWDDYDIEFHRNDSSWCANNALRELPPEIVARLGRPDAPDDETPCLCSDVTFAYVSDVEGDRGKPWAKET